jgi:excisionase family DNA binding protein
MEENKAGNDDKQTLLSVPEACKQLGISKWTLNRLIRERIIDSVRIGSRRLIPASAIVKYVEERLKEESES